MTTARKKNLLNLTVDWIEISNQLAQEITLFEAFLPVDNHTAKISTQAELCKTKNDNTIANTEIQEEKSKKKIPKKFTFSDQDIRISKLYRFNSAETIKRMFERKVENEIESKIISPIHLKLP